MFLRFNGIAFGNYLSCLSPRVADISESAREAKNLFDQASKLSNKPVLLPHVLCLAEFLKMCAPIDHPFYKAVFNTQIFINFVEQRSFSYSTDTTLAFFDECTEKVIKSILLPKMVLILFTLQLRQDPQVTLIKPLAECQKYVQLVLQTLVVTLLFCRQPDVTVVAAPPHGIGLEHDKKYT